VDGLFFVRDGVAFFVVVFLLDVAFGALAAALGSDAGTAPLTISRAIAQAKAPAAGLIGLYPAPEIPAGGCV
jgi:hypothetical protein